MAMAMAMAMATTIMIAMVMRIAMAMTRVKVSVLTMSASVLQGFLFIRWIVCGNSCSHLLLKFAPSVASETCFDVMILRRRVSGCLNLWLNMRVGRVLPSS